MSQSNLTLCRSFGIPKENQHQPRKEKTLEKEFAVGTTTAYPTTSTTTTTSTSEVNFDATTVEATMFETTSSDEGTTLEATTVGTTSPAIVEITVTESSNAKKETFVVDYEEFTEGLTSSSFRSIQFSHPPTFECSSN